jgi:hypothetical protein
MAVASSQNEHFGPHGEKPRNGDALLLSAGERVAGFLRIGAHLDETERLVHARADLRGRHAEVLRAEAHVLLDDGGTSWLSGF